MIPRWILLLIIAAEVCAGASAIIWKRCRPTPPAINDARLDAATAADLRSLRQRVGTSPAAWLELGEAYLAYGYFPEAEACLRHTVQMEPDSFPALYAWAYALQRLGRLAEAVDVFHKAIDSAPEVMVSACWYHIGRCHLRRDDVDAAARAFAKAPGFAPAKYQHAKILLRSGRVDEALEMLEKLVDAFPNDLQPLQLLAAAQRELGHHQAALELTDRAERATGKLPLADHHQFLDPIRLRYGASRQVAENAELRRRGQHEQAAQNYRQMMQTLDSSDRRKIGPMLAALELQLGRPEAAEAVLLQHFEHSSKTPQTLMLLGDAQAQQQRDDEALRTFNRALQMRPGFELHSRLTRLHEHRGNDDLARHHAARAFCHQGIDAYREDQLQPAVGSLKEAVDLDPDQPLAWFYLGKCYTALGHTSDARQAYERCRELDPLRLGYPPPL